ncbi:MAG: flagellar motor protein MotB [Bacillota bacterium]|nr:flagellar motor protein MotB [Bacillota bacterium]
MSRKKGHDEDHVDETWLLPYSDMLTLLLALFIVMFAMSKVDKQKAIALSRQFNVIFSGGTSVIKDSGGNGGSSSNIMPVVDSGEADKMDGIVEQDKMIQMKNKLEEEIKSKGYADKVKVDLNAEGLNITIQDTVLFNSGEADILKEFDPVLLQIASMIKDLGNDIRISGHTDNVPISNSKFRSNWDLSYMRASNVMNFMVGAGRIAPDKFSIEACGEYKPQYDNSTAEGRAKNRRVEVLIVRKYPVDTNNTK